MMIVDLSHPIRNQPPCTFTTVDKVPSVYFEEGDSHGDVFITSRIDNLYSNLCTHIDFPGHIPDRTGPDLRTVGEYPIERFVGDVAIVDVSARREALASYFDPNGYLSMDLNDAGRVGDFIESLEDLAIGPDEIESAIRSDVIGLVLYSGLSRYWAYGIFNSWQYAYFYNLYFTKEACEAIRDRGMSFVGVDAFQLEHPIINFSGDEQMFAKAPKVREFVHHELQRVDSFRNHDVLLSADILIYENLRVPAELAGRTCRWFGPPLNLQLDDLNDNALCRPVAVIADGE